MLLVGATGIKVHASPQEVRIQAGPGKAAPALGLEKTPAVSLLQERISKAWDFASIQLGAAASGCPVTEYPAYTVSYGACQTKGGAFWTSGFFPGCLWRLYEKTGKPAFIAWARDWTAGLEGQKHSTGTHDIGFLIMESFGNAYRLTMDPSDLEVVLTAAGSLATRYDETVGCIRSWDWGSWQFPVIIDNLMNLELLFFASKNGGPAAWHEMASSHAARSLMHHVRPDGSTFHLVDFDPATGAVPAQSTWQGFSEESTWSRGQAWAIYGFTMVFRETSDPMFLEGARRTADYFIQHLPADAVPFWDFDAPDIPTTEKDSSAAAIAAAGLLELSGLETDPIRRELFLRSAKRILRALCTPKAQGGYLGAGGPGGFLTPGILMHGCYNHPDSFSHGTIPDGSLIWGDYYLLEALLRFEALDRR